MNMSDPIADMLARIKNAGRVLHPEVKLQSSRIKVAIAKILKQEGFINDYRVEDNQHKQDLVIALKYQAKQHVIDDVKRISKPSCRVYSTAQDVPMIRGGFGIVILSTPIGVITGKEAKTKNVGGEVLCAIY